MPTLTPLAPSLASPDPLVARWPGHTQTVHALVALAGGDRAWSAGEDGRATELGLVGDRIVVGTSSGRVHVVAIG